MSGHRAERTEARCPRRRHAACSTTPLAGLRNRRSLGHDVRGTVDEGKPLEIGVVSDERHCDHPCDDRSPEVPEGVVDDVTKTRSDRARSLDDWAEQVNSGDLKVVDTRALRTIAGSPTGAMRLMMQSRQQSWPRARQIAVGLRSGRCWVCRSRPRSRSIRPR